jgi:hypothetical protein
VPGRNIVVVPQERSDEMRNEEPTRTDPPPGFTGDRVADVGASLSRESALAEGFADARLVLLCDLGHVELRRL